VFNLFKKNAGNASTPPASPVKGSAATPTKRDAQSTQLVLDLMSEKQLFDAIVSNRWDDVHALSVYASAKTLGDALSLAASKGKLMSLFILLERGAPLELPVVNPLYYAVAGGCHDAVRFLLERRAPLATAHAAVQKAIDELRKDMLLSLAQAGASIVGRPARETRTSLHTAAARGNVCNGILQYLLANGAVADLDALDGDTGATPLVLACKTTKASTNNVRSLLAAGAKPSLLETKSGQSALFWAAVNGKVDAVDALLAAGADATSASLLPSIAAHIVHGGKKSSSLFDGNTVDAVVALVAAGASASAKGADGLTAAKHFAELVPPPPVPKEDGAEPTPPPPTPPAGIERLFGVLLAAGADASELAGVLERLGVDAIDVTVDGKRAIAEKRAAVRAKAFEDKNGAAEEDADDRADTDVKKDNELKEDKEDKVENAEETEAAEKTADSAQETVEEKEDKPEEDKPEESNDSGERTAEEKKRDDDDDDDDEDPDEKTPPKKKQAAKDDESDEEDESDESDGDGDGESTGTGESTGDEDDVDEKFKKKPQATDDDDDGSYDSDEFDYDE
jgi:ankyrin repeat protein